MNFPLLTTLRSATAEMHHAVEAKMNLLDPAMTEAEYFAKLATLGAWTRALLEARPAATTGWDPGLEERLTWLSADLTGRGERAGLKLEPFAPDAWWGVCYVVEGSSLGGQVLCRQLGERWPTRYFAGRGAETGKRWMAFLGALRDAEPALDAEAVADGATRAFAALMAPTIDRN